MEKFEIDSGAITVDGFDDANVEIGSKKEKFLRIRFPLSESGEALKQRIINGDGVEDSELPSVEDSKTELFADLDLSEQERKEIFERELSNIQVTKGCRHQCTFCAATSSPEVEVMPFPAIVKLAEKKSVYDEQLKSILNSWLTDVERETGYTIEKIRKIRNGEEEIEADKFDFLIKNVIEIFNSHPIKDLLRKCIPSIMNSYEEDCKRQESTRSIFLRYIPFGIWRGTDRIANYYDSDPFDYKDFSFVHKDGSPADYGDVVRVLASEVRPIHITTAGWSETDKVSQTAANKIASMNPALFIDVRLSVNQYEVRARKDLDVYLRDTLNVIRTLAPLGLKVLIFNDKKDENYSKMCKKIISKVKKEGLTSVEILDDVIISAYSGPMKNNKKSDDHHDVMACMAGFHIWPNGIVVKQESSSKGKFGTPKGARPIPTGKLLWKNL